MNSFAGIWKAMTRPRNEAVGSSAELAELLLGAYGYENAAKIQVSPDRALQLVAVYACVRVIAEGLGQTPLIVYRRRADGGRERAPDHPLWRLLHEQPNGWMTPLEFKELLGGTTALRGNGFAFKNVVRGEVRELLPIHPNRVKVEQDANWNLRYTVRMADNSERQFAGDAILHLRGLGSNGFEGLNPIQVAREAVGLAMAAQAYGGRFFGNNSRPAGILAQEGGKKLNQEQIDAVRDSWNKAHGGANQLGTAVLDGGWKWQSLGVTNEDAQFLETRKFQRSEIAALFRVPPHLIGDLERATFSNIEQQSLEFVQYTMLPWFVRFEERFTLDLMPAADRAEYFVEFLADALLRGDMLTRSRVYREGVFGGWLTRNEVRVRENMNPLPGLDDPLVPLNVGAVDGEGDTQRLDGPKDPPPAPSSADVREAETLPPPDNRRTA